MTWCYVTLCLSSEEVSIKDLCDAMVVPPSRLMAQGDPAPLSRKRKKNGWFLTTNSLVDSENLDDHVSYLYAALGEQGIAGTKKMKAMGVNIEIACLFDGGLSKPPAFSAESLRMMLKMNINDMWIDIMEIDKSMGSD